MSTRTDNGDFDGSVKTNILNRTDYFLKTVECCETVCDKTLYTNAVERYKIYSHSLSEMIDLLENDPSNNTSQEKAIISLILTGSLLEATIVFFLLAFLDDYEKDSKYHWKLENGTEVDIDKVKRKLFACLEEIEKGGEITSKQKRSIKKAIKDKLSIHEDWKMVTNFTLDDLISFCQDNKLFSEQNVTEDERISIANGTEKPAKIEIIGEPSDPVFQALCEGLDSQMYQILNGTSFLREDEIIDRMRTIQKSRNNIHIFTSSATNSILESLDCASILCKIISDLGGRISWKNNISKAHLQAAE